MHRAPRLHEVFVRQYVDYYVTFPLKRRLTCFQLVGFNP